MKSVSIVIPVFNAEATIGPLVRALVAQLSGTYSIGFVLVNDGSSDRTDAICRDLIREFGFMITYLRLAHNFGEHSAIMAGLNYAQGNYVVIMDDDFQNPPEEVPALLREIQNGFDVVYCSYPQKQDAWWRNLGSRFSNFAAGVVLHKPSDLYLSSFKVLNRFLVREIIRHHGFAPHIDAIILRSTTNIGSVQVRHQAPKLGRSRYSLGKLISLWGNLVVSYSLVPLRIIGVVGLALATYGMLAMTVTLVRDWLPLMKDHTDLERLSSVIAFFRGFQLLAISVLGEYIGRIYLLVNREPQFVIREAVSANPIVPRSFPGQGEDSV